MLRSNQSGARTEQPGRILPGKPPLCPLPYPGRANAAGHGVVAQAQPQPCQCSGTTGQILPPGSGTEQEFAGLGKS